MLFRSLSSNGSTSQASICGSTLALMDAGVPIKAPVAGKMCIRDSWYTVSVTVARGWEYARFWENRFPLLCHRQINYLKEVLYYE